MSNRPMSLSRRHVLGVGAGAATALLLAGCGRQDPRPTGRMSGGAPVLELIAPNGPHGVGMVSLHLLDPARRRELMVHIRYPAQARATSGFAPWMSDAAAARFRDGLVPPIAGGVGNGPPPGAGGPPGGEGGPPSGPPPGANSSGGPVMQADPGATAPPAAVRLGTFRFPTTHSVASVPAATGRAAATVLWSPGHGDPAALSTQVAEELASFGYVVVVIDHTGEAAVVEFPDGRLEVAPAGATLPNAAAELAVRVADLRFVLDQLTALHAGRNPDVDGRALPTGFAALIDPGTVGVAGHSLGGSAAAAVMAADRRIKAGIDIDGSIMTTDPATRPAVLATALGPRPFMLLTSDGHGPGDADPTLRDFWSGLTGWHRWLGLSGSAHHSFTDRQTLLAAIASAGLTDPKGRESITAAIGTIDAARSVSEQRVYLTGFFDLHLRGRDTGMFGGNSAANPEMRFLST